VKLFFLKKDKNSCLNTIFFHQKNLEKLVFQIYIEFEKHI